MTSQDLKLSRGELTVHGKYLVAGSMYAKGKNFLGAALLLHEKKGYDFVVLHLLCQGIEITLKGLLLYKNYDKYWSKLKTAFGHDLKKLAAAAAAEFGVKAMKRGLLAELDHLNRIYSTHRLRYGTSYDILVNPETIPRRDVLRKIASVIRLADRHLRLNSRGSPRSEKV
jgi:hypothetical protein